MLPIRTVLHATDFSESCAAAFRLACSLARDYGARLIVEHGTGEADVQNITGEIRASVRRGRITVGLREEGKYEIDAKSYLGGVVSDFSGHAKPSRQLLGTQFVDAGAPGETRRVYLRVGYGDILILKVSKIAAPAPMQ